MFSKKTLLNGVTAMALLILGGIPSSAFAFCLFNCKAERTYESVRKELLAQSADCDLDVYKLILGDDLGRDGLIQKLGIVMNSEEKIYSEFKRNSAGLDVTLSDDVKETCRLSDLARRYNPGTASALFYIQSVIPTDGRNNGSMVSRVRINITSKKRQELYQLNREAVPVIEDGKLVLNLYVNAGDYDTGLTEATIMRMYTREESVQH